MKKKIAALLAVGLCLALMSCSDPSAGSNEQDWGGAGTAEAIAVQLPDGGSVVCVVSKNGYSGGLSCDWDHVNRRAG